MSLRQQKAGALYVLTGFFSLAILLINACIPKQFFNTDFINLEALIVLLFSVVYVMFFRIELWLEAKHSRNP